MKNPVILACAFVLTACASPNRDVVDTTVAPVPFASSPAAEAQVRAAAEDWTRGFAEKDGARIGRYLAEDFVAYYPRGSAPTVGQERGQAGWVRYFSRPGAYHPVRVDEITVSRGGDMAWGTGTWWHGTDASGVKIEDEGKFLTVWQHFPDGWKIVALSARSYRPNP